MVWVFGRMCRMGSGFAWMKACAFVRSRIYGRCDLETGGLHEGSCITDVYHARKGKSTLTVEHRRVLV